ncbi:MAG: YdcF family protein [Acidobacteria bacterium]|nr:YdcF family protein [Acidobacteriota bacterium]
MPLRAKFLLAVVLLLGGLVVLRESCFRALGAFLVQAGEPTKADVAVVLAGDWRGLRVLRGGELVKAGYVPVALVDGPLAHYGLYECDLAVPFAVKHGFPESAFLRFPIHGNSTDEEARLVVAELRRQGWKRFLLVTSNFHTRRAGRIFRKYIGDLQMTVVAAPDASFTVDGWWKSREGRKTFAFEWMKTVTEPLGF